MRWGRRNHYIHLHIHQFMTLYNSFGIDVQSTSTDDPAGRPRLLDPRIPICEGLCLPQHAGRCAAG